MTSERYQAQNWGKKCVVLDTKTSWETVIATCATMIAAVEIATALNLGELRRKQLTEMSLTIGGDR